MTAIPVQRRITGTSAKIATPTRSQGSTGPSLESCEIGVTLQTPAGGQPPAQTHRAGSSHSVIAQM
jgi:hypothetical protein